MPALEAPLEMERRHVREGLRRLAAQEVLIVHLELSGPESLLPAAYDMLARMREFQGLAEEHLARLLAQACKLGSG